MWFNLICSLQVASSPFASEAARLLVEQPIKLSDAWDPLYDSIHHTSIMALQP